MRSNAKVSEHAIGTQFELFQLRPQRIEACVDGNESRGMGFEPLGGGRKRFGVVIEADDCSRRADRVADDGGVSAEANRAINHGLTGLGGEQAHDFIHHHWRVVDDQLIGSRSFVRFVDHSRKRNTTDSRIHFPMHKLTPGMLLAVVLLALTGCSRMRFVIDAVPAVDELTETEVLTDTHSGWGADKIALIDVTGLIIDATGSRFLGPGENPVARFAESLERARTDSHVKAVIVRINSPGGAVTASDVMYRELVHFKEASGKPVVVLMADLAASGGYYLACGGDEIIAHPTTVTGSIGVIIQTVNFSEGMHRIGIHADSITSGPNKAMGSPFEPEQAAHREILQGIVNEFYAQFVGVVTSNRPNLKESDRTMATDGRVVSGVRAVELGLVDKLGDMRDAFASAKAHAGIASARLVKYHRPLEHVGSAYANAPNTPATGSQFNMLQLNLDANLLGSQPGFYYLWDPAAWLGDAATR